MSNRELVKTLQYNLIMRFHPLTWTTLGIALLCCSPSISTEAFNQNIRNKSATAFLPRKSVSGENGLRSTAAAIDEVVTEPIAGMRPGTSGLRKKVDVWQGLDESNKYYVENFIQSLIDTAKENNGGEMIDTVIVAGDGRYFNEEAIQIICRVLAANGVADIWIPQNGIMSTPAVSAAIRRLEGGKAKGGIVLTASHNPGGPGEDFGIKYNEELGQPAGEDFTEAIYEKTLEIKSFKILKGVEDIDLSAKPGTVFEMSGSSSKVTIVDPFDCYIETLKECFDFDALSKFGKRKGFSLLFDGMHGAGGPFAKKILVDELGLPESSLLRCNPLPDFGKCHPDPNLTYAAELVEKMGLNSDGSANTSLDMTSFPTLGAANDGDGDRNLIAGAQCFVTPSDSLAIICNNWEAIPHFSKAGGPKGVARSMPSSAALDVVAEAKNIPCFVTPTGWKFFGNLMSSKEMFGKEDFTPFICGEESFGTGSDHVREKDGIWAVLSWMSILMKENENVPDGETLISVKDIVDKHWSEYGRHFYCRYDYEAVESDAANEVMDLIRESFVDGDVASVASEESDIKLVDAIEFGYEDPVDGSKTSKQGLILQFEYPNGDSARVVFRLSGTGSAGATIRMYLEKFEKDTSKHDQSAPAALESLAARALSLVKMEELTGRDAPTVIT